MENLQKTTLVPSGNLKYHYLCRMNKEKEINWLFPEIQTEVSLEEFRTKVHRDEQSGDMSFKDFINRLETWNKKLH